MKKARVLLFAADPHSVGAGGTSRLQLDEEVREIRKEVGTATYGDDLEFDEHWAARPRDLLRALAKTHPRVVHFSGHCGDAGLVLVGSHASRGHAVGAQALAELFERYPGDVRVVVLNACLSLPQAEAIAAVVGCAIGTHSRISDGAAITFSSEFYRAIASGDSVQDAFESARAALSMEYHQERDCPQLVAGPGVDASKVFVVEPKPEPKRARVAAGGLVVAVGGVILHNLLYPLPPACFAAGAPTALMAQATTSMAGPSGVKSDLGRAKVDYAAGHYAAAFPRFRRLAQNGNPEAMGFVGAMFLRGHGTGAYPDSGIHWLRQAASRHDPKAMTALGDAYLNGEGVRHSLYWARHWYHKAVDDKRSAEAMRRLGALEQSEQDHDAALSWFQNAVRAGSVDARVDAGQLYEQGRGTPRDLEIAVCLYRTAADVGSVPGMLAMGRIYRDGIGVRRDYGRAGKWYRKAADRGSPEGMQALGELKAN